MISIYDVMNTAMEEYYRLCDAGKFTSDDWDDSEFSIPLPLPFPKDYTLLVKTYSDYYGEDDHFVVEIQNRLGQEMTSFEGKPNGTECEDLEFALYHALFDLCTSPWYDYHAENAWKEFSKISVDADGKLTENFLHFREGDSRNEVIDWFGKIYQRGIMLLLDPPAPGETIDTYRIPLEWKCRGYIDVPARSLESALTFVKGGQFQLPRGEFVPGSMEVLVLAEQASQGTKDRILT